MTADRGAAPRRAEVVDAAEVDPVLWDMNSDLLHLRRELSELRATLDERERQLSLARRGSEGSERAVTTLKGVLTDMVLKGRAELDADRDEAKRLMAQRLAVAQAEADALVADAVAALTTALGQGRDGNALGRPADAAAQPPLAARSGPIDGTPPQAARPWPWDVSPPAAERPGPPGRPGPPAAPDRASTAPPAAHQQPPSPAPPAPAARPRQVDAPPPAPPRPGPVDAPPPAARPWGADPGPGVTAPAADGSGESLPLPTPPSPLSVPPAWAAAAGSPPPPAPPAATPPAPPVGEDAFPRPSPEPPHRVAMNGWGDRPGSVGTLMQTVDYDLQEQFNQVVALPPNTEFRTPPRGTPAVPTSVAPTSVAPKVTPVTPVAAPAVPAPTAAGRAEDAFDEFWPSPAAGAPAVAPGNGHFQFGLIDALLPIIAVTLVVIVVLSWIG